MIRFVKGILRETEEAGIVVEAGGIGYWIRVPLSVLSSLPALGEEVKIYTYFSIRQDAMELFGFLSSEDRETFELLLSVSGVGPRGAISILSALSSGELRKAIVTGDSKAIQAAQGIGKRTAERVVLDLKDKIGALQLISDEGGSNDFGVSGSDNLREPAREAMEALVALGYSPSEASRAVRQVGANDKDDANTMTADDILKQSLRYLL